MDPTQQMPTGLNTDGTPLVTPSVGATGVGTPLVNPAQAQLNAQTNVPFASQNPADVSAIIASYEQRNSRLMSEKDKAIYDRAQALTQVASLQQQLAELQTITSASLTQTTDAAQQALNEVQRLRTQEQRLNGELLRSQTLLQKPHLADYAEFLPTNGNADEIKAAVEKLEAIRQRDLERNRSTFPQSQQQQQVTPPYPAPGQPASAPIGNVQDFYNLYNQRPTMTPIPGSNPAQMHPAGGSNVSQSIDTMLKEARDSGDPAKFQAALEQAKLLATSSINQQLGRS